MMFKALMHEKRDYFDALRIAAEKQEDSIDTAYYTGKTEAYHFVLKVVNGMEDFEVKL